MSLLSAKADRILPLLLGGLVTVAIGGGIAVTGLVSEWEVRSHLSSILPSVRFLASTVIAAGATILSLLLALISFSQSFRQSMDDDRSLQGEFYRRVRVVGRSATIILIGATLILSLISIPLESEELEKTYYLGVYYVILAAVALLSGGLVFTITYLYRCVSNLIDLVNPDVECAEHPLVEAAGESEENE